MMTLTAADGQADNRECTAADIWRARLDRMKVDSTRLPEVGQFLDLVQSVQRNCLDDEYNSLAAHVRVLQV